MRCRNSRKSATGIWYTTRRDGAMNVLTLSTWFWRYTFTVPSTVRLVTKVSILKPPRCLSLLSILSLISLQDWRKLAAWLVLCASTLRFFFDTPLNMWYIKLYHFISLISPSLNFSVKVPPMLSSGSCPMSSGTNVRYTVCCPVSRGSWTFAAKIWVPHIDRNVELVFL